MPVLTAKIVCGAANNQLAHPGVEKDLADRGILYAPDYVVNAGGVIQVADELHGFDFERCKAKATKIFDTTLAIFARAKADGIPPAAAADRIAEQRMAEARAAGAGRTPGHLERYPPAGVGENSHVRRRVARQEEVKIAVDQRGQGTSRVLRPGASCGRRTVWARAQVPWKPYGPVSLRRARSRS